MTERNKVLYRQQPSMNARIVTQIKERLLQREQEPILLIVSLFKIGTSLKSKSICSPNTELIISSKSSQFQYGQTQFPQYMTPFNVYN